jgi:hypothetical protein
LRALTEGEPTYHSIWENVKGAIRRTKAPVSDREQWLTHIRSELSKEERYAAGVAGGVSFATMTPDRKFELMRQTFVAISRTYGESMRHIRDEAEASQVTFVVRAATPPSAQRASSA